MKTIHNITISVFAKPEEDTEKIKETFIKLFPFDPEEKKFELKERNMQGFEGTIIKSYEVFLDKPSLINEFLSNLLENLSSEQKELLVKQKETRLDDESHFFIRLEKDKLIDGEYWITDSGNCYHIKLKIAAFPATREKASEVITEIFKS